MSYRIIALVGVAATLLTARAAVAQVDVDLRPQTPAVVATLSPNDTMDAGTLVRIRRRQPSPHTVEGRLLDADSGAVTLLADETGWRVAIPRGAIRRFEVGRVSTWDHRAWSGAKKGLLVGGIVWAVVAVAATASASADPCGECSIDPRGAAVFLALPIPLATGILGALIGGSIPGHQWKRTAVPAAVNPAG